MRTFISQKLKCNKNDVLRKSWFIPIFTVININKNKLRLVWDAAATMQNVSLNSVLIKRSELSQVGK